MDAKDTVELIHKLIAKQLKKKGHKAVCRRGYITHVDGEEVTFYLKVDFEREGYGYRSTKSGNPYVTVSGNYQDRTKLFRQGSKSGINFSGIADALVERATRLKSSREAEVMHAAAKVAHEKVNARLKFRHPQFFGRGRIAVESWEGQPFKLVVRGLTEDQWDYLFNLLKKDLSVSGVLREDNPG